MASISLFAVPMRRKLRVIPSNTKEQTLTPLYFQLSQTQNFFWFWFGYTQVSCYPWGCGYTVKDSPQGQIQLGVSSPDKLVGKVQSNMDVTNRDLLS